MWWGLQRILSSRFRDFAIFTSDSTFSNFVSTSAAAVLSKVALRRMARKQVSFQDRKKENTPKFPSIEKWYQAVLWCYLRLMWVISNLINKHVITAIENIRFELYFRFISIQTYRMLYFSRRLLAKHHTLSSWCRIFSGRSRSHKIRLLSTWKVFVYCCHGDIDFTKSFILTNNNS